MAKKDFSELDRIKLQLVEAGLEVRFKKDGVEIVDDIGIDQSKIGEIFYPWANNK